ncbi:potassium channel family protein [Actinomyces minihominis]|uniref:potassium channel family protein n=1 Tax=Actinomyces minihominis TaxID=2002838 RepID=UPI000C06A945|nr:potassium channel family protein [Actinomyces minihominis]
MQPIGDQQTWDQRTHGPLMLASVAYLVAYTWRSMGDLTGVWWYVASATMMITWAMFVIQYLINVLTAPHKLQWITTHWSNLIFALFPVLRLVLLLKFLTKIGGRRVSAGDQLRLRVLVYGVSASAILIYTSALAVLEAERHAHGASITNFKDALWWACVTVTTTGYGAYTPVTNSGRLIGVLLMFGGLALLGVTTATLASLMTEIAARHGDDTAEPATRGQIRDLTDQIAALHATLQEKTSHPETTTGGNAGTTDPPGFEHSEPNSNP